MKSFETPRMSISMFKRGNILTLSDIKSVQAAEDALNKKGVSVKVNFVKSIS